MQKPCLRYHGYLRGLRLRLLRLRGCNLKRWFFDGRAKWNGHPILAHIERGQANLLICSFHSDNQTIGNEPGGMSGTLNNSLDRLVRRRRDLGYRHLRENTLIRLLRELGR